ncbi:hypothetical protein V7R84_15175 [Arachnia propionica]|uniref:hypothetical protein n=1 Tax=Arachnia propionica TaxID=1750 RepID=UPI0030CC77CA
MFKRKIATAIGAALALSTLVVGAPTVAQATETLPAQSQKTGFDPGGWSSSEYSFIHDMLCRFVSRNFCKG